MIGNYLHFESVRHFLPKESSSLSHKESNDLQLSAWFSISNFTTRLILFIYYENDLVTDKAKSYILLQNEICKLAQIQFNLIKGWF